MRTSNRRDGKLRMATAALPMQLQFSVLGAAQPMGSKRAFVPKGWTRPILTDSNRNLKSWQQLVRHAANDAIYQLPASERGLLLEGVRVSVAFYMPRPKGLPKRRTAHLKAPDIDKCLRGVLDAITGVVFRDDSQVVDVIAMKRYAREGEPPHVDVWIASTAGVEMVPRDQPLFAG